MGSLLKIQGNATNDRIAKMMNKMNRPNGYGSTNRRSVVIERNKINTLSPEESFEVITEKIAKVITNNREEVENALIKTGCNKNCRKFDPIKFNATVQNKLVEDSPEGEEFRNYMTLLVARMYGSRLTNTGFFRSSINESKVGDNGEIVPEIPDLSTLPVEDREVEVENITGLQKTADGGVEDKDPKDWGSILAGSAQLVNSIGGVIGMFTGGQTATTGSSVLDDYTKDSSLSQQELQLLEEQNKKRTRNMLIIGVVLVAVVVTIVVVMKRQKKGSK